MGKFNSIAAVYTEIAASCTGTTKLLRALVEVLKTQFKLGERLAACVVDGKIDTSNDVYKAELVEWYKATLSHYANLQSVPAPFTTAMLLESKEDYTARSRDAKAILAKPRKQCRDSSADYFKRNVLPALLADTIKSTTPEKIKPENMTEEQRESALSEIVANATKMLMSGAKKHGVTVDEYLPNIIEALVMHGERFDAKLFSKLTMKTKSDTKADTKAKAA
jgi:uncharacterized membrane-anchored protein YjiN (DUF445 family)